MKKGMRILLVAVALFSGLVMNAQKIGHVNVDELIQSMPEMVTAKSTIDSYGKQLQKDLQDMEAELTQMMNNFRANEPLMTELKKEAEVEKIQNLQSRMEEYAMRAQELMQQKRIEVLEPLLQKAQDAIDAVAKEKGFTYILDASQSKGVVIFAGGEDVMPLVKAKMGIN